MDRGAKTTATGAAQNVVNQIREGILTGRFALGQRLIEADLMREFQIGRSTAREVLLRLANEDLVTLVQNRGAVVRRLTRLDVEELFQIRELLEGLAAARAAERIDDADNRSQFDGAVAELAKAAELRQPYEYEKANRRFHQTIWRISSSRQISAILNRSQLMLFAVQFRQGLGPQTVERSMKQHEAIAAAILKGDARAAQRAMRRHIRSTSEYILSAPASAFAPAED